MSELADVEHRSLRSAIEYAVAMGEEAQKRRLAIDVPKELRSMYGKSRIPTGALGRLRRVIDGDDAFRELIAPGAIPELVDDVGRLWLQRPDGWADQIGRLVAEADAAAEENEARSAVAREAKRRRAAEQAAVRVQAELAELRALVDARGAEVEGLRVELATSHAELAALRAELIEARTEARHARDREAAAVARLEQAGVGATGDDPRRHEPDGDEADAPAVDPNDLAEAVAAARALADRLHGLLPMSDVAAVARRRREPVRLPGGVLASSADAARALLRSDASFLIDGYNVAKLGWPSLALDQQRRVLLDAVENLARRHGTDLTVVFDGASVPGAHADRRRMVRVVYSPEGVTADDVIRDEVDRLPADRGVVVVTNDAEIVRDVRAAGTNVLPSNALIAVF